MTHGDKAAMARLTSTQRQPEDKANQRAGKEKPEFYSQHEDPLKLKGNEDSSDKPKLEESVTNRQEMLKEVFQAEEKGYQVEGKSNLREGMKQTEMVNMRVNVVTYYFPSLNFFKIRMTF